jgi:hypothetical protein
MPRSSSPLCDVELSVFDAHVQECGSAKRGAVDGEMFVFVAPERGRKDLRMRERPSKQIRIGLEMLLQEIESSSMDRHRRSVGKIERSKSLDIIAPDRVHDLAGGDQAWPTRDPIAARQGKLRIRKPGT